MQCNKDLKYLKDNGYFDVDGFFEYMFQFHPETNNNYITRMIFKILNKAASECNYEGQQFVDRVVSMIPDLSRDAFEKFITLEFLLS